MRTLLADLDYHSGTVAQRLRIDPAKTLGDVPADDPGAWRGVVAVRAEFDVLAAPVSSGQLTTRGLPPIVEVLRGACREYDYVVADLPSALSSSARRDLVYGMEAVHRLYSGDHVVASGAPPSSGIA